MVSQWCKQERVGGLSRWDETSKKWMSVTVPGHNFCSAEREYPENSWEYNLEAQQCSCKCHEEIA